MNTTYKPAPSEQGQRELDALKSAVNKALERKRKLGQYAVMWDGKKVVKISFDTQNKTD